MHARDSADGAKALGQFGFLGDSLHRYIAAAFVRRPAFLSSRTACEKRARSYAQEVGERRAR